MAKDDRSSINPFTGKSHFDIVNDDKFLEESYNEYYNMVSRAQLLDNTPNGQIVRNVAIRLIQAFFLLQILKRKWHLFYAMKWLMPFLTIQEHA